MLELYYTLIAYFSNASCTLSKLTSRHIINKKLFGKNKTYEGLLFGYVVGLIVGFLLSINLFISLIIISSTQAGDLLGSFIKRRLKIKSGEKLPITDQLGFIVFTFFFLSFFVKINYFVALMIIFLTYPIHRFANLIAFKLKLKNVNY